MPKTKTIVALTAAASFLLVVVLLALYFQTPPPNATLDEARRRKCEDVLNQMTQTEDCDSKMQLYADHLKECRSVYDSSSKEDYNFRYDGDGQFFDRLFTNSLCYAQKGDKVRALKILSEAQYEESDMISQGPISCEPQSFIRAFASTLNFPSDQCWTEQDIKNYFLKALNDSNFQNLERFTKLGKPVSIDTAGEPHGDCPSPFEEVQSVMQDLSKNRVWKISDESDEIYSRKIEFKTAEGDRLVIFIRKEKGCEYLTDISALMSTSGLSVSR